MISKKRSTKLILMFSPLVIGFIIIGVIAFDLRNPISKTVEDDCSVVGMGKTVAFLKEKPTTVYIEKGSTRNDIGISCPASNTQLILNDANSSRVGQVEAGQQATVTHKTYRIWKDTWRVDVTNSL